jgi:cytochrome c5
MGATMSHLRIFALITISCAMLWGCSAKQNQELTAAQEQAVAERIAPAGHVVKAGQVVAAVAVSAGGSARAGDAIYNRNCMACHNSGVAGAPMFGDAGAWTARLEKGIETVYTNAINGINGMPARGTCMDCSDEEVIAAIDYLMDNSK